MRSTCHLTVAALLLCAAPAFAQPTSSPSSTAASPPSVSSDVGAGFTPAPVPSIPPASAQTSGPAALPEQIAPATRGGAGGTDAGPTNATPFSAAPPAVTPGTNATGPGGGATPNAVK